MPLASQQHTSNIVQFYGSLHDILNAKSLKAWRTLIHHAAIQQLMIILKRKKGNPS
mgnify:CR=1 FL=1